MRVTEMCAVTQRLRGLPGTCLGVRFTSLAERLFSEMTSSRQMARPPPRMGRFHLCSVDLICLSCIQTPVEEGGEGSPQCRRCRGGGVPPGKPLRSRAARFARQ